MPRGTFRVNRKKVGLTYSCPTDADENPIADASVTDLKSRGMMGCEKIKKFLTDKDVGMFQYIITWELHQSGKLHFHAYLNFDQTLDIASERWFDMDGVHPEINNPGKGWITYCIKDGADHYITNVQQSVFTIALNKRSATDAINYLWEHDPKSMCLSGHNIELNIRKRMKVDTGLTRYEGPFIIPYLKDIQSTVLIGPPGVGKTSFAIACHHFKNPLFVSHLDALKRFNDSYDGIVFDDMDFTHLPRHTQIHLADYDHERDIHVRYGVATIPARTPKIFTCNEMCFNIRDEAIARRLSIIQYGGTSSGASTSGGNA